MKRGKLSEIAERMKGIDIAILSTHSENGDIASRPMSNNGDVTYSGDSCFFALGDTRCVRDIEKNPKVSLSYSGKTGFFSGSAYVAVEGRAELIRDKVQFQKHWNSDLDRWFDQGKDTPNLVLIKVHAHRITFWEGGEEGEVTM